MTDGLNQRDFTLDPADNARLANLCGPFDEHLRQVELRLGVEIDHRGELFQVIGEEMAARAAEKVLRALYAETAKDTLTGARINLHLAESGIDAMVEEVNARVTFVRAFEDAVMCCWFTLRGLIERLVVVVHSVNGCGARVHESFEPGLSHGFEDVESARDIHESACNRIGFARWNLQTCEVNNALSS